MENLVRVNHLKGNASGRADMIPVNLKIRVLLLLKILATEMIIYFPQNVILPSKSEMLPLKS